MLVQARGNSNNEIEMGERSNLLQNKAKSTTGLCYTVYHINSLLTHTAVRSLHSLTYLPYRLLGGAVIPSRKASYGASGHSEINGVSVFVPESSSRAAIDGALGNNGKV